MLRQAVAAEKYYPAAPAALRAQLESCLAAPAPAVLGPALQAGGAAGQTLRGLIVSSIAAEARLGAGQGVLLVGAIVAALLAA